MDVLIRSTVSSMINSLAAVCLEDFISPVVYYFKRVTLSDRVRRNTATTLGMILQIMLSLTVQN